MAKCSKLAKKWSLQQQRRGRGNSRKREEGQYTSILKGGLRVESKVGIEIGAHQTRKRNLRASDLDTLLEVSVI
jgi:hypothetical protein